MPDEPDLTARVESLEHQMHTVHQQLASTSIDAQAARTLASGADRDVSEVRAELRAHSSVLNALRLTQVEHGQVLDHHTQVLDHHTQVLDHHTQVLQEQGRVLGIHGDELRSHRGMLLAVQTGVDQIIEILTADA